MDTFRWGSEFSEARQRLSASSDFHTLRGRGHDLKDGAVLTSVSDVPFEMSFKCVDCGVAFWFENVSWSSGGMADWHLSSCSQGDASHFCKGPGSDYRRNG
jgi:hypothetical protein